MEPTRNSYLDCESTKILRMVDSLSSTVQCLIQGVKAKMMTQMMMTRFYSTSQLRLPKYFMRYPKSTCPYLSRKLACVPMRGAPTMRSLAVLPLLVAHTSGFAPTFAGLRPASFPVALAGSRSNHRLAFTPPSADAPLRGLRSLSMGILDNLSESKIVQEHCLLYTRHFFL